MSTNTLTFAINSRQIQGARTNQEDSYGAGVLYTDENGELCAHPLHKGSAPAYSALYAIVADGMGGHDDGEKASAAVVEYFPTALAHTGNLKDAAELVNDHLAELKQRGEMAENAGCTLVACMLRGDKWLSTVSVGDSYIYLQRNGQLTQINELHTRGAQLDAMVKSGLISAEEAANAPKRAALTCAIMGHPLTHCDYKDEQYYASSSHFGTPQEGDRILLTSDGVMTLDLEEIEALAAETQEQAPSALVDSLLNRLEEICHPKQDNSTVVCLQAVIKGKPLAAPAPPTPQPDPQNIRARRVATGIITAGLLLLGTAGYTAYKLLPDLLQAPTEEKPAEEKPTEEKPTEEKPAEEKPAEEKPAEEKPAEEKPAEEKPAEEKPTEEKPTEEKPAEEKPTEEKPTEEKPTEEKPTEEKPTEKKPAEEKPTEKKPAEEMQARVVLENGNMVLQNAGDAGWLLDQWRAWADKDNFDKDFQASSNKPQTLLRLIYAWKNSEDEYHNQNLKTRLSKSIEATSSDTINTADLKVVKAYYYYLKNAQGAEWKNLFNDAGEPTSETAKPIATYLSAQMPLLEGFTYGWNGNDLTNSANVNITEKLEAIKNQLDKTEDDQTKARFLASLIIAGEKDFLNSVSATEAQPNSQLLLCYHRMLQKDEKWEDAFYDSFVAKEPQLDAPHPSIRDYLMPHCSEALLNKLAKATDEPTCNELSGKINKCFGSMKNDDDKKAFVKKIIKGLNVPSLLKTLNAISANDTTKVETLKAINTWKTQRSQRIELLSVLAAADAAHAPYIQDDPDTLFNMLVILTTQTITNENKAVSDSTKAYLESLSLVDSDIRFCLRRLILEIETLKNAETKKELATKIQNTKANEEEKRAVGYILLCI